MNVPASIPKRERILGGLWGSLVGDALGVPVEFQDRATVQADQVKDMRGFGTHRQPAGTWSDDGALILCTVDSLLNSEFDTQDMGTRFVEWMYHGLWTAWGEPFDVGMATSDALIRIANGTPAERAGGRKEFSNGNGSLMRIIPFFEECLLKAVNLGGDTDTTGCVAGGLAGVHYGSGAIPEKWLRVMARHDDVSALFSRFAQLTETGS